MVRSAWRSSNGAGGVSAAMSGEQPVVHLGVEDRESLPVGGDPVEVAAGQSLDEAFEAEAGQVVAGLVDGVGGAAQQRGHLGAEAPIGDAGGGGHGSSKGAGQGLDPRIAEP